MGHDENGPVDAGDDVGDGKRLTASRDAEEGLILVASNDAFRQLPDRFRLVAAGLEIGFEFEDGHVLKEITAEARRKARGVIQNLLGQTAACYSYRRASMGLSNEALRAG